MRVRRFYGLNPSDPSIHDLDRLAGPNERRRATAGDVHYTPDPTGQVAECMAEIAELRRRSEKAECGWAECQQRMLDGMTYKRALECLEILKPLDDPNQPNTLVALARKAMRRLAEAEALRDEAMAVLAAAYEHHATWPYGLVARAHSLLAPAAAQEALRRREREQAFREHVAALMAVLQYGQSHWQAPNEQPVETLARQVRLDLAAAPATTD